jgi:hypothetical protein
MGSSFKRVVERLLIAPRGSKPVIVERLQCGHQNSFEVPRRWVDEEQFPPAVKKNRERLCVYCDRKLTQQTTYLGADPYEVSQAVFPEDIVIRQEYSVLQDLAQAFHDACLEDEANGSGALA